MDKSTNYTIEIDGKVAGTVYARDFQDAATLLWKMPTPQCDTLVVYASDNPERSALYVGAKMTSPLDLHWRCFTTFQRRSDLDEYLQHHASLIEDCKTAILQYRGQTQRVETLRIIHRRLSRLRLPLDELRPYYIQASKILHDTEDKF